MKAIYTAEVVWGLGSSGATFRCAAHAGERISQILEGFHREEIQLGGLRQSDRVEKGRGTRSLTSSHPKLHSGHHSLLSGVKTPLFLA